MAHAAFYILLDKEKLWSNKEFKAAKMRQVTERLLFSVSQRYHLSQQKGAIN
jgi:hypothetical protein